MTLDEKALRDTMTDIIRRSREELYALTEEQLVETRWYFRWNDERSIVYNIYNFADAFDLYKRSCRQWEEHHNGYQCVVERVRDKYLMPKIKEFWETVKAKQNDQ